MTGPATRVAVVDYAGGNLASAHRALESAAARAGIPAMVPVTDDPAELDRADRIVLPGQGAFADCRDGLLRAAGLLDAIERRTGEHGVPFLGICVGMQLMAERGFEHGDTPGFGWVPGAIRLMAPTAGSDPSGFRLPHIGWNGLRFHRRPAAEPGHPLLDGVEDGDHVYFVHSFALDGHHEDDLLATVDYAGSRPAMIARGNRAGTQFHVEKSQEVGLRILANFLRWTPR